MPQGRPMASAGLVHEVAEVGFESAKEILRLSEVMQRQNCKGINGKSFQGESRRRCSGSSQRLNRMYRFASDWKLFAHAKRR